MRRISVPFVIAVLLSVILAPFVSSGPGSAGEPAVDAEHCTCTGFYVGSEVSQNGHTLFGQSCDSDLYSSMKYAYYDAADVSGSTMTWDNGFTYDFPDSVHSYVTSIEDYSEGWGSNGSASTNDAGVAFTGSITIDINEKAIAADPLIPNGFGEFAAAMIIGACASSAREGVEIISKIIDTVGSQECNTYLFADQNETWYMESYTGHQYCAMQLPQDKAAFFGNETNIVHTEDYPGGDFIVSEDLKNLPEKKGFAVWDDTGNGKNLNLKKTYGIWPHMDDTHMRTWIGHQILAPSQYHDDYDPEQIYEFLFTPDEKVSVGDLERLMKNRFEDTKYCPDDTGGSARVVGVESMIEAHIIEIDKNLPKDMCFTRWFCLGPSVYSVFIPISSLVDRFYGPFATTSSINRLDTDTAYGLFKQLSTVCFESRFSEAGTDIQKDIVSSGVRDYWNKLESYYLEVWPLVMEKAKTLYSDSPQKAKDYLNAYAVGIEKDLFDEAKTVYEETLYNLQKSAHQGPDRQKLAPVVDVQIYGERYGWRSEASDDGFVLIHGDERAVVRAGDNQCSDKGSVEYGGNIVKCTVHSVDGKYYVSADAVGFLSDKPAVIVDYGSGSEEPSGSMMAFGIAAAAVLIIIGGLLIITRR